MTRIRVRACARDELVSGKVITVALPAGDVRRREGIVLLGTDGLPRAYENRCRHIPIPLDAGSREFLTEDGQHLLCGTHGALYQIDDGMCIAGPCLRLALLPLELEEQDGELFVLVRPSP